KVESSPNFIRSTKNSMFVIEPDGKYAHAVAVSGFVADSNTAPSNGVSIVTPIFCTKIGTAADWIGWPVLSMATAERVFEPAGACIELHPAPCVSLKIVVVCYQN